MDEFLAKVRLMRYAAARAVETSAQSPEFDRRTCRQSDWASADASGMSEERLTDATGLTFQQVQKYERDPTLTDLATCSI